MTFMKNIEYFMKKKIKPGSKPIVKIGYNGEYYIPLQVPRRIPFRSFYFNLYDLQQDFPTEIYKVVIDYAPLFAQTQLIEITLF